MNESIDLKKYEFRTDLVDESISKHQLNDIIKEENINNIKVSTVYVDKKTSKKIEKKEGTYITITFDDITDYDNKEKLKEVFIKYLNNILRETNINDSDSCLIVGLGNIKSTPDSLGPVVVNNIVVTNHIFDIEDRSGFRPVSAIVPGVTGVTGIETSMYVKSIVKSLKPGFIIVIDALASGSVERVNKTIQICNTGIAPGSGIGNNRKEISYESLNVPVIAIGVPTVVDAATVVSDTLNYMTKHYVFSKQYLKSPMSRLTFSNVNYLNKNVKVLNEDRKNLLGIVGTLNESEIKELLMEVLTPIGYNLMVTPKEVDFIIDKLADVIGNGINRVLHKNIDNL